MGAMGTVKTEMKSHCHHDTQTRTPSDLTAGAGTLCRTGFLGAAGTPQARPSCRKTCTHAKQTGTTHFSRTAQVLRNNNLFHKHIDEKIKIFTTKDRWNERRKRWGR